MSDGWRTIEVAMKAADMIVELEQQLAERDAKIAALKRHAEAIAHDYFMSWAGDITLDEFNEYPVIAAYRAAYPKED